jgi:hypothetical protein
LIKAVDYQSMKADTTLSNNVLAFVFATHLLFGSALVLNASKLVFNYYIPRTINIIIIDPKIDVPVWMAAVIVLSLAATWHQRRVAWKLVGITMLSLAIFLGTIQLLNAVSEGLRGLTVYLLFLVGIAAFTLQGLKEESFRTTFTKATMKSLVYALVYLTTIETASAASYIARALDVTTQIGHIDAGIELQLSYASYGLLPLLYVAFLFSWIWVPIGQKLLARVLGTQHTVSTAQQDLIPEGESRKWRELLQDPRFILALALGLFIGFYPYFENPPWLAGTDAVYRYYKPLLRMSSLGLTGGFTQALVEWHPATVATFYAFQLLLQTTPFAVVKYSPIVLVITVGLAAWWLLARKKSMNFGILVFTLSVLSISTTVGLYASILSNWMALVLWAFFFAYVAYRGDQGFRIVDGLVLFVLSTLILLNHPWTWGVFAAAVLIAAILALIQDRRKGLRSGGTLMAVVLLDAALAFSSIAYLAAGQSQQITKTLDLYFFAINDPSRVFYFWRALNWLISVWSPFFSPLYIAISIAGVFLLSTANLSAWRRRLIWVWLCVSGIGSVLVAPVGFNPTFSQGTELWRLLFLTPFQLTAPLGILWLAQLPKRLHRTENPSTTLNTDWSVRLTLPCSVLCLGVLLAFAPVWLRFFIVLVALPVVTFLVLTKTAVREVEVLGDIILLCFVLVAFNNTTRALSQLLLSPHNCDQC